MGTERPRVNVQPLVGRGKPVGHIEQVKSVRAFMEPCKMSIPSSLLRSAVGISAFTALCAGCAQPTMHFGAPSATSQTPASNSNGKTRSWMLSDAKHRDLLYAAANNSTVYVFKYPNGTLVGTLSGFDFPYGLCVDRSGDIWITNSAGTGNIVEFAHGGTSPIATLNSGYGDPIGCSVDQKTGDLAVAYNLNGEGAVAVWPGASGNPTIYIQSGVAFLYCGYDDSGDLFIDGFQGRYLILRELPFGGSTLETITLDKNPTIYNPGQAQWDGQYITVQRNYKPGSVYRIKITGSMGRIAETIKFSGITRAVGASWIQGKTIVIPFGTERGAGATKLGFWPYPAGGAPNKIIKSLSKGRAPIFTATTVSPAE
jgi:hypothetical protein